VVTDFGLALPEHPGSPNALTITVGAGWGTPQYMAPEQVAKARLTPRTDIYAMGVVAREVLDGEPDELWRAAMRSVWNASRPRDSGRLPSSCARLKRGIVVNATAALAAVAAGAAAAALLAVWLVPSMRSARGSGSGPVAGVAALPDRTVSLLPFEDSDPVLMLQHSAEDWSSC